MAGAGCLTSAEGLTPPEHCGDLRQTAEPKAAPGFEGLAASPSITPCPSREVRSQGNTGDTQQWWQPKS